MENNNVNKSEVVEKVMLMMLKANGLDVPAPVPCVDEFVRKNSSKTAQDAWQNMQIELNGINTSDIEVLVRAMCMKYFKLSHALIKIPTQIREDTKVTIDYVMENPRYKMSSDEIDPEEIFGDIFGGDIFGEGDE